MQMSVPSMVTPKAIKSVYSKKIRSGLYTDASQVFRFVTDTQSGDFEFSKISKNDLHDRNLIRHNFLNNYIGYNTLIF